jgi:hypothetical protein
MHQGFVLAATCEQTVSILIEALTQHGYRLERSFDLRDALQHHPDCPCPHHGTSACNCQYRVLLAYGQTPTSPPAVITAHECDGLTQVRVLDMPVDDASAQPLLAALSEALNSVPIDA